MPQLILNLKGWFILYLIMKAYLLKAGSNKLLSKFIFQQDNASLYIEGCIRISAIPKHQGVSIAFSKPQTQSN